MEVLLVEEGDEGGEVALGLVAGDPVLLPGLVLHQKAPFTSHHGTSGTSPRCHCGRGRL